MRVTSWNLTFVLSSFCSCLWASQETYIVQRYDTLSEILQSKGLTPIYGSNGYLRKTILLNPTLKNNGNRIYPNKKVILIKRDEQNEMASVQKDIQTSEEKVELPTDIKKHPDRIFHWSLSPTISWKHLKTTETTLYINNTIRASSETTPGIQISAGMEINKDYTVYSSLSYEKISFKNDSSFTLRSQQFSLLRYAMGISYNRAFSLELARKDQLRLSSPANSIVDILKKSDPEIAVIYTKKIFQFNQLDLNFKIDAKINHDSQTSFGNGAALFAKMSHHVISVGYERDLIKATNSKTTSENIYWKYTWEN